MDKRVKSNPTPTPTKETPKKSATVPGQLGSRAISSKPPNTSLAAAVESLAVTLRNEANKSRLSLETRTVQKGPPSTHK